MFSLASIATMSACIFLFGVFYSIGVNFTAMVRAVEEGVAVTVFFQPDVPQENIDAIGQEIADRPEVANYRFVTAEEYANLEGNYQLTAEKMKRAKKDMLVLHPLPRVDEIAQDVDDDPRAVYFRQARFGMFGRMALLLTLSKLPFERAGHHEIGADPGIRCSNHKCITRSELYVPLHGKVGDRCPYCDAALEMQL